MWLTFPGFKHIFLTAIENLFNMLCLIIFNKYIIEENGYVVLLVGYSRFYLMPTHTVSQPDGWTKALKPTMGGITDWELIN